MRIGPAALCLVAGCASQASSPDLPDPVPIDVVVVRNGEPVSGATVVFDDERGAVVAHAVSDGDGAASSDVPVSSVTVIDPGQPTRLITVALDESAIGGRSVAIPLEGYPNPPITPTAMLAVDVAAAPPAGTDHFTVVTGCGTFTTQTLPARFAIGDTCIGSSGSVPVVVEPCSADLGLEHPGNPLAYAAGHATRTGADFGLDASAWSTTCDAIDVANPQPISLQLWQRYDGLDFRNATASFCEPSASAGFDYASPLLALDDGLSSFSFENLDGSPNRMALELRDLASTPASLTADDELLTGKATLVHFDAHGASWTRSSTLDAADLVLAVLSYPRGTRTFVEWRYVVPATYSDLTLPALPASAGDYGLDASMDMFAELRFIDATWTDAYGQELATMLESTAPGLEVPPEGRVREYREQFPGAN